MIIDFHTHVFPDKIAERTVAHLVSTGGLTPNSDGKYDGLLSALGKANVSLAVNLPVVTRPDQFESILRFAGEINKKHDTGAAVLSFAGIHPADGMLEEHLYRIKEEGFLGIKVHPEYQDEFIDSPAFVRLLGTAKSLGLITVTHAGVDPAYLGRPMRCTPTRVLRALDRIGGYPKLVLAHMGGNGLYDESAECLAGEDVYLDTAFVLGEIGKERFLKIFEKHGEDKILFASDSPWQDIGEFVSVIKSFALGQTAEEKILYANASKLLFDNQSAL